MSEQPSDPGDLRARLQQLTRYTITSEGASKGYFRLVEDRAGAWTTWAEVEALLTAVPEAPTWQPIETAPKDGTWILAYGIDKSIKASLLVKNGDQYSLKAL